MSVYPPPIYQAGRNIFRQRQPEEMDRNTRDDRDREVANALSSSHVPAENPSMYVAAVIGVLEVAVNT